MALSFVGHYTLRYKNANGRVAHELLIDLAEFDKSAGLKVARTLQNVSRTTGSIPRLARGRRRLAY
jgi:hypothetical protein